MCRAIYNNKDRDYNTWVVPIIFPIYTFYNMIEVAFQSSFYLEMY
jgi:hypothetical protein